MTNRAKKVDANQAEIVAEFRSLGWNVDVLSWVGHGVPDLFVTGPFKAIIPPIEYVSFWVEIKSPKGKLTKSEQEFIKRHPDCVEVVRSVEDVHELTNLCVDDA